MAVIKNAVGTNTLDVDASGRTTVNLDTTINSALTSINTNTPALIGGRSPVGTRDYGIDLARGNIANESVVVIRGYNSATSTTNEPIWAQSGTTYPTPTTAQTLTLSSFSALDTAAGTGAQVVLVKYVRFSDLVEVTQTFNLSGQTPVTVTTDGYAVNDIRVVQAGTGAANAGTIYVGYGTVTLGVPANMLSTIVIGANVSQQAVYTVPSDKVLEVAAYRISPSVLSIVQFRLRPSKTNGLLTTEYDIPIAQAVAFNSPAPSPIPAGYQIQMWARTNAGAGLCGVILQGTLRNA